MNKFTNPIYKELKSLKLISDSNLIKINNKTRDKKISVFKDNKQKIIFLEKFITKTNYYKALKYEDDDRNSKKKLKFGFTKTLSGKIKLPLIEDDLRRINQFENWADRHG